MKSLFICSQLQLLSLEKKILRDIGTRFNRLTKDGIKFTTLRCRRRKREGNAKLKSISPLEKIPLNGRE